MKTTDGNLNIQEILKRVEQSPSLKVKVAVTDVDGILRGKYLSKEKFLSSVDTGFGFCNVIFGWDSGDVCYDNVKYTGWHTGYPDALAKIDLNTYRTIPWENNTPFFLAEFVTDQNIPLSICPRQILRKVIGQAKELGYEASFGVEYEWFNFQETPDSLQEKTFTRLKPLTPGMFGYSVLRTGQNAPFFDALFNEMAAFQIPIEGLHTETGPGVFEAAILYTQALESADRAVLFKTSAKQIAHRFGILPTFMAKWDTNLPGCSGHLHQSLWKSGKNEFFDDKEPHKMSAVFQSYLAGQMALSSELLPFFAPNVNSYKRLVEGHWAPTKVTWAVDNRTASFRVISGSNKSTRLETRVAGSDANPYLAIAAALGSGLYGIRKGLKLKDKPVVGNAYRSENVETYSKNLKEATQRLVRSEAAREIFGSDFVEHFVETRLWEWRRFEQAVTNWELNRYFEII